jgi:alkanesulfonate monooxygenase SsuD/methylene tetrahydromethanopterin reductase-like flavin-dependent oxidoreductase (luciferase family)
LPGEPSDARPIRLARLLVAGAAHRDELHSTPDRDWYDPVKRGIKLGFAVPTWTTTSLAWRQVLEVSRAAVDVGFDSLWVSDHLLLESTNAELRRRVGLPVPDATEELAEGYMECFSTLAGLAAVLGTVQLGSFVASTRYRNPALLAKIADSIDSISDGRFVLGVGAGDAEEEHHRFGFPTDNRVSRFEEALVILRGLLTNGELTFNGAHYQARQARLFPRGPRKNGPPIMIGTFIPRPRMQRLVVQYADIWNVFLGYGIASPEAAADASVVIDEACQRYGRDPASLKRTAAIRVVMPGGNYATGVGERPLSGSPEQMAEVIARFADSGMEEIHCAIVPGTVSGVQDFARVIGRFVNRY